MTDIAKRGIQLSDFSPEFPEVKELAIEKHADGYQLHIPKGTVLFMNIGGGYWSKMSDDKLPDFAPLIHIGNDGKTRPLALRKYSDSEDPMSGFIEYHFIINSEGLLFPQTLSNWLDGPEF